MQCLFAFSQNAVLLLKLTASSILMEEEKDYEHCSRI